MTMTLNPRVQGLEDPSNPLEMFLVRVSVETGGAEVEPICPQDKSLRTVVSTFQ
jgi:hypothetical protein